MNSVIPNKIGVKKENITRKIGKIGAGLLVITILESQ
jgi:hypothetical protein